MIWIILFIVSLIFNFILLFLLRNDRQKARGELVITGDEDGVYMFVRLKDSVESLEHEKSVIFNITHK